MNCFAILLLGLTAALVVSRAAAVYHRSNALFDYDSFSARRARSIAAIRRAQTRTQYANDYYAVANVTKEELTRGETTCKGFDPNNASEITLSPLSKNGTVLVHLQKPADFDAKDAITYKVADAPTDNNDASPSFAVNASGYLYVTTDRLYDNVDLSKHYDQPSVISISASSGSKTCIMYYMLRFFDAFFAFEPDWEANPVLESGYHFALDCPGPNQALGVVGDEKRNAIYHVKYAIENDNSSDSELVRKLFAIDQVNGRVQTSKAMMPSDPKLQNATKQFRVSASAAEHHAVYAIVYVLFGKCDGTISSNAGFDTLKRHFIAKCAAPGDIIGQLPRGTKKQNFTSYLMYPEERDFSVTADGQIRVREVDLKRTQNYSLSVSAPTADGQVTVYEINIEVQPRCDLVLFDAPAQLTDGQASGQKQRPYTLPNLGTIELACPYASQVIANLSSLKPFAKELQTYLKRLNAPISSTTVYFGTNSTDLVQVTPDTRIYWLHRPGAFQSLSNLDVEITAQAVGAKRPSRLGYIQLTRRDTSLASRQGQMQSDAQQNCNLHKRRSKFQQTIDLQCPVKGSFVAYVSTAFLSPIIRRSTFEFRLGQSEFLDIERTSGIIYVKKTPPTNLQQSTALPVTVIGQPNYDTVLGERVVYDGLLNVRISCLKPPSDSNDDNREQIIIKCEAFDFGGTALPIGVAIRGGRSLNREFVAQVFADVVGDDGTNNMPKYRWSLVEKSSSGYQIDPYSGRIHQTNAQPTASFIVRATSTARPDLSCAMRVLPKLIESSQMASFGRAGALGLINRQPPRFLSKEIYLSRTAQACEQVQGKNLFALATGFNLGRVVAYDPDDGLAGAINYTLCAYNKNGAAQNCGEALKVDIPAANTAGGTPQQLFLKIDSREGNIFVARTQLVGDQQPILFRVRASNTRIRHHRHAGEVARQQLQRRGLVVPEIGAEFIGLPASQSTDTALVIINLVCTSTAASAAGVEAQ